MALGIRPGLAQYPPSDVAYYVEVMFKNRTFEYEYESGELKHVYLAGRKCSVNRPGARKPRSLEGVTWRKRPSG